MNWSRNGRSLGIAHAKATEEVIGLTELRVALALVGAGGFFAVES